MGQKREIKGRHISPFRSANCFSYLLCHVTRCLTGPLMLSLGDDGSGCLKANQMSHCGDKVIGKRGTEVAVKGVIDGS